MSRFQIVRPGCAERIGGLLLRHYYLLVGSMPRIIDLFYWQTLNMLTWGFLNYYITKQSAGTGFVIGTLLGCAIMWDVFVRTQVGVFQPFIEEYWSRNLGNIFVSPLSSREYVLGLVILSVIRILIAMAPCVIIAGLVFHFWLTDLGWPLIAFWANLAFSGWWGGFILISMLLRFGSSAEWLAWMLVFAISPLVGAFYPIDVLPVWVQHISRLLPQTYVFEGMRALISQGVLRLDDLWAALALNIVFLIGCAGLLLHTFEATRKRSGLLQLAE